MRQEGMTARVMSAIAIEQVVEPYVRPKALQYLEEGKVVVFAAGPLVARLPAEGLTLLVAGGLSYTLGAFVFLLDNKVRYSHFVWHLFVLGGSVCHFFAALWYAYG